MATVEFKLPELGEGVVEGEIVKWLVQEGEEIEEDQGLVEMMTDKATVTVPSPANGKLVKHVGKEGDIAEVHGVLAVLEVEGAAVEKVKKADEGDVADAASAQPKPSPTEKESARAAKATDDERAPKADADEKKGADSKTDGGERVLATPVTRRMAREHGIDLADIEGTGPQGRVLKVDVEKAIEGGGARAKGRPTKAPSGGKLASDERDERVPLRGLRRKIAEKMVQSKFTAPHFTFVEEVDSTDLVAARKRINAQLAASKIDAKLTFLPFIVKATIAALKRFPNLNSNFDDEAQELIVRGRYNIGMAVATDDGLTVAVIKDADRLSLIELASEIARLGEAARDRKLTTEELTGSTFTITSLGQTGGLFATPIINYPEVAILGVHRMRKRPVVKDDEIVIRDMMNLSLAFDHRVIDGNVGADFTYEIIKLLEQPDLLFAAT